MREFDYDLDYKNLDIRAQPELYRVGRGEQGVLLVEPYKSEILPHWRFATPDIALESSDIIYQMFLDYLAADDFIGADMARKFIQMGYTRARRYANHKGGKKYKGAVPDEKKDKVALMVVKNYHAKRKTLSKQSQRVSSKRNGICAAIIKAI